MTDLTPPPSSALAPARPDVRVGTMHVNGNKQYRDATESHQRVSTLLKNLKTAADSDALEKWKLRQVALGLAARADLVLGVAAAKQVGEDGNLTWESKKAINGLCKQATDASGSSSGANQGNAVHTATERLDLGESIEAIALPYPFSADLQAYATLKRAMRLSFRPEHIERSVRTREVGTVGTYDRIGFCEWLVEHGLLAPDELIVVDVKTEASPLLNLIHIAPQLATYANADAQFIPDREPARLARAAGRVPTLDELAAGAYEAMPNVSKTIGLVVHVRDGRATPYLVDLVEGWEAARAAAAQRERSKRSSIKLGEPGSWAMALDVPLPAATAIVQQAAETELAAARERAQQPVPVGGTVTVAGVEFTKRSDDPFPDPWTVAQQIAGECSNCAPLLTRASATRVDSSLPTDWCLVCGAPAPVQGAGRPVEVGVVQQAVRGPDGLVTWEVTEHPLETQLVDAIRVAGDLGELARLYDAAVASGLTWSGWIADEGSARGAIVSCVQRELHTTGACACGWREGLAR